MLGSLQENLITLLSMDKERCLTIRNVVEADLFGGPYRTIVVRIYDFIDKYKKPPKDHLADILSDKLESKNVREAELYTDIIQSIHAAQVGINSEYVMAQLETFVKRQSLRGVAVELAKALQRDTEESLEEAESLLSKANKQTLGIFDPGTRLSDKKRALGFLDSTTVALPTGIPELDKRGFGPTRKEMWLYIANSKSGKTWMMIHLAKMALIHRVKVCHITLEMSEARCSQRYLQALFAISKRKESFQTIHFEKDKLDRISGFADVRVTPTLSFDDPNIKAKLAKKIDKAAVRWLDNIYIKQFPTGSLTVNQLEAYLDNLEQTERFIPDLLIIDYPDLMKLDAANFRLAIDDTYKRIRGLLVARNIAGAVVSQSHRSAAKSKLVGSDNVAEAYSKIAHADTVITYTSTKAEHKLGLARLHVAGGRNDEDRITICISQQYGIGAYMVDSTLMSGVYWENLPAGDEDEGDN